MRYTARGDIRMLALTAIQEATVRFVVFQSLSMESVGQFAPATIPSKLALYVRQNCAVPLQLPTCICGTTTVLGPSSHNYGNVRGIRSLRGESSKP